MAQLRSTHTYAVLEVPEAAYDEIEKKLTEAEYQHCFHREGNNILIDMSGIALKRHSILDDLNEIDRLIAED